MEASGRRDATNKLLTMFDSEILLEEVGSSSGAEKDAACAISGLLKISEEYEMFPK